MNQNAEAEAVSEVEVGDALATISKAEIDIQIATAKKYPRSIQAFQRDIMTLATADTETARSMFYVVPRDGKTIEGASVRLAEAAASCWGNAHFGARVIAIDAQFVTAQAVAWDMEKNYRVGIEVKRRITDRRGQRYSNDMIITTSNAALAIAFRNAVFKVVPAALTKKAYNQAKQVSLGKELTMEQRRKRALDSMIKIGAKAQDIFRLLKRRGEEDLTVDDLINLNGIYTAIQDGDTTWAEVLANMPRTDAEVEKDLETVLDKVGDGLPKGSKEKPEDAEFLEVAEDTAIGSEVADAIFNELTASKGAKAGGLFIAAAKQMGFADYHQLPKSRKAEFRKLLGLPEDG